MSAVSRTRRSPASLAVAVLAAVAVLGFSLSILPAPAAAQSATDTTTEVRPATGRLFDVEHDLIVFINKSRADLCTEERIAFEHDFLAWLDGGAQGDPPAEPPDSQQGVKPVEITDQTGPQVTTHDVYGADLPVEVWAAEDEIDGIDCTATDGPGAQLLATGTMTWRIHFVDTPGGLTRQSSLQGTVNGLLDGQAFHYLLRYLGTEHGGHQGSFHPTVVLVPIG